ncbi:MAG: PIN domain-containing protein [Bacilli bacterium]
MIYKFYDTCSLLLNVNHLWDDPSRIVISSITLEEIENIKTSANKDIDTKFAARKLINELDKHFGEYIVVFWNEDFWVNFVGVDLLKNNDAKIIMCANEF